MMTKQSTLSKKNNLQTLLWAMTNDAILITNVDLHIQQANLASTLFTGYSKSELVQKSLPDLSRYQEDSEFYKYQEDTEFYQAIINSNTVQLGTMWQGQIWQRHKNGSIYLCDLKLQRYELPTEGKQGYAVILSNKQSTELSLIDPLTELPNRVLFDYMLSKTHAFAQRHTKRFALLFISLDNLQIVNKRYGYHIGDQLLMTVGNILKSTVRDSDTVVRYSGNVFSISLDEIAKPDDAALVGQMILFKLTQNFSLEHHTVKGAASIGIAVYPEDADQIDTLLNAGQLAMQKAKTLGGMQCYFCNTYLQEHYYRS